MRSTDLKCLRFDHKKLELIFQGDAKKRVTGVWYSFQFETGLSPNFKSIESEKASRSLVSCDTRYEKDLLGVSPDFPLRSQ